MLSVQDAHPNPRSLDNAAQTPVGTSIPPSSLLNDVVESVSSQVETSAEDIAESVCSLEDCPVPELLSKPTSVSTVQSMALVPAPSQPSSSANLPVLPWRHLDSQPEGLLERFGIPSASRSANARPLSPVDSLVVARQRRASELARSVPSLVDKASTSRSWINGDANCLKRLRLRSRNLFKKLKW
ncbi:hypothetical protein CTheo_4079 [Ceratobasidium theobromae]|uniref:Uncharacterized protein n=1 Tax=Ceratobasidium theobromae TaxID=1582974 RepID=A0A5N5QLQ5_9AGAM|nr:hypothetical protein CTheo_4079 [Ceratobasidium theobromae]